MAAGLGFKTFTTGEVLTAADTNGYLMQGVLVFASAAARDAAITSPQEGQCCYLKDTDAVLTYSGSAWVGFDDSNAIQNSIVDAKGDLITATAADTPARLAVGANNTVLTADSAEATGMKWAAAAASSGPTFQGSASVQNPTQNVDTKVTFTTENWDSDACYTSSTFTPNKAGYYQVNYSVALNDCGRAYTTLFKTGNAYLRGSDSDITNFISQGSILVDMNGTTDYLEVYVLCQGAGARNVGSTNQFLKRFDAVWVRGL